MRNGKLTEKEKLFIEYYISTGGKGAKSARLAGYAKKGCPQVAHINLSKPYIRSEIDARMKVIEAGRIADIIEVKKYWTSVMRGNVTEKTLNTKGIEVEHDVRVNSRLRASENLAKSQGLFLKKASEPVQFNIIWEDKYGGESEIDGDDETIY